MLYSYVFLVFLSSEVIQSCKTPLVQNPQAVGCCWYVWVPSVTAFRPQRPAGSGRTCEPKLTNMCINMEVGIMAPAASSKHWEFHGTGTPMWRKMEITFQTWQVDKTFSQWTSLANNRDALPHGKREITLPYSFTLAAQQEFRNHRESKPTAFPKLTWSTYHLWRGKSSDHGTPKRSPVATGTKERVIFRDAVRTVSAMKPSWSTASS